MDMKKIIKREIEIQKSIEGEKCQDELLLHVLSALKTSEQWRSLITMKLYRYGKFSFECHRFYYPKEELLKLMNLS